MHLIAFNILILKLVFRIFKELIFFYEVDVKNVSAIVKKLIGIILFWIFTCCSANLFQIKIVNLEGETISE